MAVPFRAVWVDEGNDADYARLARHGITRPCYSLRDPRVTLPYLKAVRDKGLVPGVYVAWNWYPELDGHGLAEKVNGLCVPLFRGPGLGFPFVCVDIEVHDTDYVAAFFRRWRQLRPQRVTDFTLEGFQGGLWNGKFAQVQQLATQVRYVVPQAYTGPMTPTDAVAVNNDLVAYGFPYSRLSTFYSAAALPAAWSGYAFTQGMLP